MKRGKDVYFRAFLIITIIVSIVIIVLNLLVYSYSFWFTQSVINARVSNTGIVSLTVEGEDVIFPDVSIIYPINTIYTSHVTRLNYSVGDNSLEDCWYSLNRGVTNTTIVCGENVTGISSAEGSNTWIVYANDTSGNENSSSVTFTISIPSSTTPSTGGGGGGGGGMPIVASKDFDLMPKEFDIAIVSGRHTEKEIRVVNTGKSRLTIDISASGIKNFISVNTNQLILESGEEKSILLAVQAPESGVHAGKIIFKAGNLQKEVLISINVRSEKKLFDVSINIPDSQKEISIGEDIDTFISLIPVGEPVEKDVNVKYTIKDFDGNVLDTSEETMPVSEVRGFMKRFATSKLSAGDYIIAVEMVYSEGFIAASARFKVIGKTLEYKAILAVILSILAIIIILYAILKYKKAERRLNMEGRVKK